MKITKKGHAVKFEFRHGSEYIRRVVLVSDLAEFLLGGRLESNLGDGKAPESFRAFAMEKYLPRCARPNLKDNSYKREHDSALALSRFFGNMPVHEITLESWEKYKTGRLNGTLPFSRKPCVNSTVDKEFDCLKRILSYAERLELVKRNVLSSAKGLKVGSRRSIWLRSPEIDKLLAECDGILRDIVEFRILTGARPSEALHFGKQNVDTARGEIWIRTLKKRDGKEHRRYILIKSLGPRFAALLKRLKPHPVSGLYFANPNGNPLSLWNMEHKFLAARDRAGLGHVIPYDLRGTFAMHRAMIVKNFRQLQTEMGHGNPQSIQSYLDEASRFAPEESIFFGADVDA